MRAYLFSASITLCLALGFVLFMAAKFKFWRLK
jgi:hypothetical protein